MSLSHYCPTVARLAFRTDISPGIVPASASLVGHVALEGLDAREALPPLLRPGVLMDRAGDQARERSVIEILRTPGTSEAALAEISAFTERLQTWTPHDGELSRAVEDFNPMLRGSRTEASEAQVEMSSAAQLVNDHEAVRASVPAGVTAMPPSSGLDAIDTRWVADAWPRFSQPLRHLLAAHAFGNWYAYHGMGLRTVVRSLATALAVVRVEAARQTLLSGRRQPLAAGVARSDPCA